MAGTVKLHKQSSNQTVKKSSYSRIKTLTNSEYAPGLDAEDLAHGLQGIRNEVEGTGFVSREKGGTAVVVEVEGDVGGTM